MRQTGFVPTTLMEFVVNDRDRIAELEGQLAMEKARRKDAQNSIADLAERALELHFAKEQLEAELARLRGGDE